MLRDQGGSLPPGCPDWQEECVVQAIKAAGTSAPGVDGIPYEAYKKSAAAASILQAAAKTLYEGVEDFRLPGGFNRSAMIFLPKKASGTVPNLGDYYLPKTLAPCRSWARITGFWPRPSSSAST
eukprot:8511669-Alexandrium_andersonii.AAC.1